MKRLVLTALLMVTALPFAFGQAGKGAGEQEEQKFIAAFSSAMEHNDLAALDRMMTPDYKFVNPSGGIQTKEDRLAPMKSGDLKYDLVKYDEFSVRRYGDVSVVIARATVKGHMKTTDVSGQFRATLVLQQTKGQWKLVSSQASPLGR